MDKNHYKSSTEHKNKMKQKIEKAAMETLTAYGLESFTIDLVAKNADLGKGTIYRYFKNKNELLLCLRETVFDMYKKDLLDVVKSTLPDEEKIELMLKKSLKFFSESPNIGSIFAVKR